MMTANDVAAGFEGSHAGQAASWFDNAPKWAIAMALKAMIFDDDARRGNWLSHAERLTDFAIEAVKTRRKEMKMQSK